MISYEFYLPLIFLIVLIILVSIFIVFSRITFKHNTRDEFSFKNRFPFELYYQNNLNVVSYFRLILILIFVYLIIVPSFYSSAFRTPSNIAFGVILSIFFVLADITGAALFLIRPTFLKQFKMYVTFFICFTIAANVMAGIISFTEIFEHFSHKIVGSFSLLLALTGAVLALNPKIKDWAKMETIENHDGSLSYIRPKTSILAVSLWINYLLLITGEALLLVNLLLASLI